MEKEFIHPIENIMSDTLRNLKEIVDISTVVGDIIKSPNGVTIIPISKIMLGYVGGGGEYNDVKQKGIIKPFATGSGAGLTVQPIGFLIEENDTIRFVQTNVTDALGRFVDVTSDFIKKLSKEMEKNENKTKND